MNEKDLQEVMKDNLEFKMQISDNVFTLDEVIIFQTDNPVKNPTSRGGVYFAELKELKVKATLHDVSISKYLSNAMLGPNKEFLDIILEANIKDGQKLLLVTNLTNTVQKSSEIILYLTLKDTLVKSK